MTSSLKEPDLLLTALRQYSHNHGEGFVFGYDKEETDRIVTGLVDALERLVLAAQCRDNSTGCQLRLVQTREELSAAAKNAEEVLVAFRKQGGK